MQFRLDLPIGLPSASYFQCTAQPLAIWPPLGSNISVFTYWSPHSGINSGSSFKMGNILAFWDSSSCGSFTIAWGPSLWWRDSMNKLCSTFHSSHSYSSRVSAWYVDLWRTWPFSLMIFAIKAEPMSMLGPSYLPSLKWSSGNGAILSWNITHSNCSNPPNWLMSDVYSYRKVSGTSPSSLSMLCIVLDLI